jgi:hypothetical protein
MPENYELLETGQIEIMHQQTHDRVESGEDCDMTRQRHDSLAAELVKRGIAHDTEIVCPEIETDAPNYRRGFTDDVCTQCAFGQLFPFCNLYKFDYLKGYTCDSFRYFEVLELEPPHGFLMASGKQTAIATPKFLDSKKLRLIVSNGEVFGIAELEPQPAQVRVKEFDSEEWLNQHRITQRERRQWWADVETFYIYHIKEFEPYEGVKLWEGGKVINEPRLTPEQWRLVSTAKELPKQIILESDFVELTGSCNVLCGDKSFYNRELKPILNATFNRQVDHIESCDADSEETIPLYSLALVRNPRMRVSKKKNVKQEGDDMPFAIRRRERRGGGSTGSFED